MRGVRWRGGRVTVLVVGLGACTRVGAVPDEPTVAPPAARPPSVVAVAAGTLDSSTVVALWMSSRGHRHNILTPEFRDAGVGVVDAPGSAWGTYWVMMYGRTDDGARQAIRCHP